MKASPLSFLLLKFLRVNVEANSDFKVDPENEFDFDGALLGWSIDHGKAEKDNMWWVAVGFRTSNEGAEKICPYDIDMQALGMFSVASSVPEERREAMVYENGAALVYGAIRDMVSSITSRSVSGAVMLPTPTFLGEFELRDANAGGFVLPPADSKSVETPPQGA